MAISDEHSSFQSGYREHYANSDHQGLGALPRTSVGSANGARTRSEFPLGTAQKAIRVPRMERETNSA